jgi:hypothetical protein
LLKLLERVQQLGERRKLLVVCLEPYGRRAHSAGTIRGGAGDQAGARRNAIENRLQIAAGKIVYETHAVLPWHLHRRFLFILNY